VLLVANGWMVFRDGKTFSKSEFIRIFEELARLLLERGVAVYTNAEKNHNIPVAGTIGLRTTIEELVDVCGNFKAIVAVPTGLTELLSLADCNLLSIFPEEFSFNCESFKNWAPHTFSYLWKNSETDAMIQQIVDKVEELRPIKD
jgi:hypothetical protein